jgi:hypothetical protein
LLVLVTAQLLDLPLCADELQEARHDHADAIPLQGASLGTLHPVPDSGPGHDDSSVFPDCLCHFIFVSTSHTPDLEGPPVLRQIFAADKLQAPSAPPFPISHIPLA